MPLSENNWDANLTSITALLLYCRLTSNCWNIKTEITKRVSFALSTAFTVGVIQFSFFPDIIDLCRFPFSPFDPFGPAGPCFPGGLGGPTRPFPYMLTWNRNTPVISPTNHSTLISQMDLTSFCLYWWNLLVALGFNIVFYQEGSSKVTRRIPLLVEAIIAVSHQVWKKDQP